MIETFFRKYPFVRVFYKGLINRVFSLLDRGNGVRIMEEDWDNLIILDACRFDTFEKINRIKGRLSKKISLGSHTREWIHKNFRGDYPDTVFISGNPQISKVKLKKWFGKNPFFHIEEVWDYGWDEEDQFLHPDRITEAAIEKREKYPDKRFIVHYMQPHWPFPSPSGLSKKDLSSMELDTTEEGVLWELMRILSHRYEGAELAMKKRAKKTGNIWDYMREGKVDIAQGKKAYEDNLKLVLEETKKLVEELEGKKVITSDHGNLFGEHFMYGHPYGLRFKELTEVPWLEVGKDLGADRGDTKNV